MAKSILLLILPRVNKELSVVIVTSNFECMDVFLKGKMQNK